MRVLLLALLVTIVGTSTAFAFTATSGFSATTYANGFTPSTAPAGLAFIGGTLYAVDPADGGLYRATSGSAPLAATRVATLGGGPTGIAALGGALYVTRATVSDVVRVDPSTGAIVATVATAADIPCANALAADPVTGDLFVTSCDSIWRITTPGSTPAITRYTQLFPGGTMAYGITFAADDTMYVAAPVFGQLWRVQGPTQAAGSPPLKGAVGYVTAPRGVTQIGSYLFVSGADGTITKVPLPELGGANLAALTGGDPGDLATLGPDGCVYASQGAAIVRLGDAAGGCALAVAAPPPPPATLTLVNNSTSPALIGGGDQTFTATLANVANADGVSVTFTVTGANARTSTTTTAPNGVAGFAYTATAIGTDTVVATATVSGAPLTSNALFVVWPRAVDTAPPTISYVVTGTPGPAFGCPQSNIGLPGVTEYCGWFVTPPTITWTITPNGPSGIDATRTDCPPFTLVGSSPITGTPVTCHAYNGDDTASSLQVVLQATVGPPSIAATAYIADGVAYIAGTPTTQAVTVLFTCDSALGAAGVTFCSPPVSVNASVGSVSGNVTDVTGTVRTATFGPIVIDRAGPTITATATRFGGGSYTFGAWANVPVTLTFSCVDPSGVASCPAPVTITAPTPSTVVSAVDTLGNTTQVSFGPVNVDLVAPSSTLTQQFGAISIAAADAGSGVASVTYVIDGGAPTTVGGASAAFTLAAGTHTVVFFATDAAGNAESPHTSGVVVPAQVPTTVTITSGDVASGGLVSATLTSNGAPVAGEPLVFTVGTTTRTAATGANGVASADLGLAPGTYTLTVTYAGAEHFLPSSATRTIVVYAMTHFVVWSANASVGATVQFYGDDWSKQIADNAQRKVFGEFKGYAQAATPTSWSGRGGDAVKAPRTVPEYIGVILTSHASKTKDVLSGDVVGIAIVHVTGGRSDRDRGATKPYDGRIGDRGFGTVVGVSR